METKNQTYEAPVAEIIPVSEDDFVRTSKEQPQTGEWSDYYL